MNALPTKGCENGTTFTVADFYEDGRERLSLGLVAGGDGLSREVAEPVMNRPGLALTGFFKHFAFGRLQVVGNAEWAYLGSLKADARLRRVEALLDHGAYCLVYTNGRRPSPDVAAMAERRGAVVLATPLETSAFVHHGAHVLERLAAPRTTFYGTMVEVYGLGVLFEGAPGMGKSETALGLIKRGSALVADDLTCIRKEVGNGFLFGSASDATKGFMEIRGIGIMNVPRLFGVTAVRGEKRLQLVITFRRLEDVMGEIDRVGQTRQRRTILGVDVPNIVLPVSEGRDLVNLVETAAMEQKMLETGYDPAEDLSERLRLRAERDQGRRARQTV